MSESKFRKKPVVIEAVKFDNLNYQEIIDFTKGGAVGPILESETAYIAVQRAPIFSMSIQTKEGVMKAFPGDYVIKEPFPTGDRDFYPCKPDIFEKTYERIESPSLPLNAEEGSGKVQNEEDLLREIVAFTHGGTGDIKETPDFKTGIRYAIRFFAPASTLKEPLPVQQGVAPADVMEWIEKSIEQEGIGSEYFHGIGAKKVAIALYHKMHDQLSEATRQRNTFKEWWSILQKSETALLAISIKQTTALEKITLACQKMLDNPNVKFIYQLAEDGLKDGKITQKQ